MWRSSRRWLPVCLLALATVASAQPMPGSVIDLANGQHLDEAAFVARAADARRLLLGERHDLAGDHAALPVAPPAAATDASPAPASITAAPPAPDAPPADFQAGAASDQWEARLMARLERYRYYPAAARSRRQQGTAWVRASIDREGRLLALRLEQSSGQPMLDDAALQTFRRAQPLPPIPDELKAPQELVVPVEYYLR